ncbi:MAG TPA: DUF4340 domain-containing protein [Pseudobdellovibrionaceae bacterium]|nr:DUF4340 domain-containing protein [Pseudobdellovibrionaceae bacterium]
MAQVQKSKSFWFAMVVAALGLFTWFDFYREKRAQETESADRKLVQFQVDQVQQISVRNKFGKFTVLRDPTGWSLTEPIKDLADNTKVEEFIGFLRGDHAESVIKESIGELGKYHLDEASVLKFGSEFEMTLSNGQKHHLQVADLANFEQHIFAQWKDNHDKKVLLLGSQWRERADVKMHDWRDQRLFRSHKATIESVTINGQQMKYAAINDAGDKRWMIPTSPKLLLDQSKVMALVDSIVELRAEAFFESLPEKLVSAPLKIEIKNEKGDWTGSAFLEGANVLFLGHQKDTDGKKELRLIGRLKPDYLKTWKDWNIHQLRDAFVLPKLAPSEVKKVIIQTELKKNEITKQEQKWVLSGSPVVPAAEVVNDFLTSVSKMKVELFLTADEEKKAPKLTQRIQFLGDQDRKIFELSYGGSFVKNKDGVETIFRFARVEGFDEVFGLPEAKIAEWQLNEILK